MATNFFDPETGLIPLTRGQFEQSLQELGTEGTAQQIANIAAQELGQDFSYETLKDGSAPFLNILPSTKNLPADERMLSDEEIISRFTTVQDFGKFEGEGARKKAFAQGALRAAPEAAAGGLGFAGGVKAVTPFTNLIPAFGLPGFLAKGAILTGGGLTGMLLAAFAADEAEKEVFGEADPILPSLRPFEVAGESFTLGLSLLHAPWTLASKKQTAGAELLQNFRNVASGKFAANLKDATELTAKNAGLSEKNFRKALEAQKILQEKGQFSLGLGFNRFNPGGRIIDPTLGPVGERVGEAISKGIQKSLQYGRENASRVIPIEVTAAGGAGIAAGIAEDIDPGDAGTRFAAELIGSAIVPIPASLLIERIGPLKQALKDAADRYMKGEGGAGVLDDKLRKQSAERIYKALKLADDLGDQEGEAAMEALIEGLVSTPKLPPKLDPVTGEPLEEPLEFTAASLATALDLPMNKVLQDIEQKLFEKSDELKFAGAASKDALKGAAKTAIMEMINTGDPLGMLAAARIQQAIYEQYIKDEVSDRLMTLFDAAKRVIGQDDPAGGSDRVNLTERIADTLTPMLQKTKEQEAILWGQTGDYILTRFPELDENGAIIEGAFTDTPNLVKLFEPGGELDFASVGKGEQLNRGMGPFKKDIDEFLDFFGADPEKGPGFKVDEKSLQLLSGVSPKEGGVPYTAKRVYEVRSGILEAARQANKTGNNKLAKSLNKVANALDQDLMGDPVGNSAYNTARAFTKARNNVWETTFLGDIQSYDPDAGGKVVNAGLLADNLFKRNDNRVVSQRLVEMQKGVKFGIDHGLDENVFDQTSLDEALELLLRDSFTQFVERIPAPSDKAFPLIAKDLILDDNFYINQRKLEAWRKKPGTKELFKIFPHLNSDTANVSQVKRAYTDAMNDLSEGAASPETKAFQSVIKFEELPSKAVTSALGSESPVKAMKELVNLIKNPKPYGNLSREGDKIKDPITGELYTQSQALGGLRRAIMTAALEHAGGSGLNFKPEAFFDYLFAPMRKGASKVRLIDFMRENNLLDGGEIKPEEYAARLQKAIRQMRDVDEAFATGRLDTILFQNPTSLKLVQAKILGASLGQGAIQTFQNLVSKIPIFGKGDVSIGGGLIAAEAGSEAVVNTLLRGPETTRVNKMVDLFADPKALGEALKKIKLDEDRKREIGAFAKTMEFLARQTGRRLPYLIEPSLEEMRTGEATVIDIEPEPEPATQPPPVSAVTELPTPRTAPAPMPAPTLAVAPQVTPPSQPVNRARFAAMFPNDPMSALIRQQSAQQGIGSLMG